MTGNTVTSAEAVPAKNKPQAKTARADSLTTNIIEIRQDREEFNLLGDIKNGLRPADGGEKSLPTLLLYDEAGLKLFEKITYLEEYYLTNSEIEILETYASHIAERIQPNSIVLELGSGNLRKVRILLDALERAQKPVEYYALDVSLEELERTLSVVPDGTFRYVKCLGLHGTYDDGLEWLKSPGVVARPKTILTLGSSIGNFNREDGASFLRNFATGLQPGDTIIVAMDGCKDPDRVFHAYNDRDGVTHEFILNGLLHANKLLGHGAFDLEQWNAIGEYDEINGRHHAFVAPKRDVTIDGVLIHASERIHIEESYKYSPLDACQLWDASGLIEGARWSNLGASYALHMASKPNFQFPLVPEKYAASPVPSLADWDNLWAAWDTVTQRMIPKEELLSKPIKLRNACIFYIGHIPTFLAIHLNKATNSGPEGLAEYQRIFERGIDPDVENPELCHDHSEIPDAYPPISKILNFQTRVRNYLRSLYDSGEAEKNYAVRKAIWIGFEHETMHLETLLYMLVQSETTLPPPGVLPDFEALANEAEVKAVPNQWIEIPARKVTLGLVDDDADTSSNRYYGWDNEKPQRSVDVRGFTVQARPITNGEYAKYLEATGAVTLPASWSEAKPISNRTNGTNEHFHEDGKTLMNGHNNGHSNGYANVYTNGHTNGHATNGVNGSTFIQGKAIRTLFGPVPLKFALDWPVMASYDELAGFARWSGGRIPTMEEVKSIYEYVDELKGKDITNALGKTIPAVNSHLINDGVEETPPHQHLGNGAGVAASPDPQSLFVNLEGANVGFKHFHPVPVTPNGGTLAGQGEFGGVWEWTSTALEKHDGFEPMDLYPGYTADFFDKKHNIVLGGSWATHPRIAGRKSFVNWYQRNYPYVWAGARLAKGDQ